MHDAVTMEATGLPCALIITEPFLRIRDRVAELLAVPGYPSAVLRHPISIKDRSALRSEAERSLDRIVDLLTQPSA